MGRTIGIVSLKGGVGKTSTVAALGDALADFGMRVLLVDANYSAPNLGFHLNILDPEKTVHDVLSRVANFSDATYIYEDKFHVVPAHLYEDQEINPFTLRNRLKNVKKKYDIILIDSSPNLNDETLGAMIASDEIFAVTTPDYSTLATTIKAVKEARGRGTPVNGIILNKVHNKGFELSVDDIEDTAEVPVMAVIPNDINVMKAQSKFVPSTMHNPNSRSSTEFRKLAATLIGQRYKPFKVNEFFNKITPPRHEINREIYYQRVFDD